MAIEMVKIMARVTIGTGIVADTPYFSSVTNQILSFNVDKNRGKPGTFSASLKVLSGQVVGTIQGDTIVIEAGTDAGMPTIFTGYVKGVNISPCREDPSYVILNLTGEDALGRLAGKKFTRRCRSSRGVWVSIEAIARPGLRSGGFQYVKNDAWLDSIGSSVNELPDVIKTNNIPDPKKTSEKPPMNKEPDGEVSLSATFVNPDGGI